MQAARVCMTGQCLGFQAAVPVGCQELLLSRYPCRGMLRVCLLVHALDHLLCLHGTSALCMTAWCRPALPVVLLSPGAKLQAAERLEACKGSDVRCSWRSGRGRLLNMQPVL